MKRDPNAAQPGFAALLAHELGNPLHIGRLVAQDLRAELEAFHVFLLDLAGEDLDPEVATALDQRFAALGERLDSLLSSQQRMAVLVEELRGGDPQETPEQAIDQRLRASLALASRGCKVSLDWQVEADEAIGGVKLPASLDRVVLNLAINACQAIERQAAVLGPEFRGRLQLHCHREEGRLRLILTDNGCGIAPGDLPHLLEPGFSTRLGQGGRGLGLAYCNEVIQQLGGSIAIDSTPGQGCRVCIALPVT